MTETSMRRKIVPPLSTLLFSSAAFAQAVDDAASDRLDVNGDGMISEDEAQANQRLSSSFADADANADGTLTADEYQLAFDVPRGQPELTPRANPETPVGRPEGVTPGPPTSVPQGPPDGVPSEVAE